MAFEIKRKRKVEHIDYKPKIISRANPNHIYSYNKSIDHTFDIIRESITLGAKRVYHSGTRRKQN